MQSVTTCLMFVGEQHGRAEEAMTFYVSLFEDSQVVATERHGPGDEELEGTIMHARFTLVGREFIAMDSGTLHSFSFTPAVSVVVDCDRREELDELYDRLSDGGAVLMPLQEYPFSARFGWVQDRFGVSWQLSLAGADPPAGAG